MKNNRFIGNKKIKYFLIAFVALLTMTFGYSMLKQTLSINGTNKIKKNSWIIYFDNVDIASDSVSNEDPSFDAHIINADKDNIKFSANLKDPGDFYEFTVYTVNDGSLDAAVKSLEMSPLTEEQKKYLEFKVTYDDNTEIKPCDILYHKGSEDGPNKRLVKATVKFKDDLPIDQYPTTAISLSLFFKINYEQNTECGSTTPTTKHKLTIDPTGGIYNKRGAPVRIYLEEGEQYTFQEATRELYNFKNWKVVSPEENGTYTFTNNKFTMGSEDVYISAEWIEGDYVARIMNTYYKTVQEAFDAANGTWEDNTVWLLRNVTESPTNNTPKAFTFNLNGKTLTGTVTNSKNSTIDVVNGTIESETAEAVINNGIFILGEQGLPMNTENSVRLIGKTIGLKNVKTGNNVGEFYFYDGYIEGDIGIVGGYTDKEDKYYVFSEHISEKDTQRVYLIRNPNRAVAKTTTEGDMYYYNLQDAVKVVEQNKKLDTSFTDNDYVINVVREFEAAYEINIDSTSRVFIDTKGHDVSFGETITNDGYVKFMNTEDTGSRVTVSHTIINNKNLVVDNLTISSTTDENTIDNKYAVALFNSTIQGKNGNGIYNEQSARINMDDNSILTSTNGYGLYNVSNNLELSNGNIYGINNNGTVTLKDDVKVHNVNDKYAINNNGTVNINGGEVTDTKDIELIKNNGTINVNDGLVSAKNTAIKDGTININGGEVTSTNGPTIYSSNTTVNDGTVSSEDGTAIYSDTRNGKATINGGTVSGSTYGVNTNQVVVNGGTVSGNTAIKDYRYINPNNSNDITYGKTTITGGTINGVTNGIVSDNLTMSNATVNSAEGVGIVVNREGTILSGTVVASTYGIDNKGDITLGSDDKNIISNNPSITGGLYGLYNEGDEANFYDGQLIGAADSHYGEITGTPTGGSVFKNTETINNQEYQKEYVSDFTDWLQVGSNTYNNLDDASQAVEDNGTIVVTRDVDITFIQKVLGSDKHITLDLSGKVITSTQTIENEAILTIVDSTNSTGAINPRRVSGITNNNKLTIESGNYNATSDTSIINNGEMIINSANVSSKKSAIINNGDLTINNINLTNSKIGIDNKSNITIKDGNITVSNIGINNLQNNTSVKVDGGNITATNYGIYGDYGDIDITDGTITSTTNNAIYTYFGTIDVDGGNITSTNNIGILSHNNVTINGGTITGTIGIKNELYCPNKVNNSSCSYKTITVNDGHIIGTIGDGINMTGTTSSGKVNIYGGTVEGKTNGLYTTANTQIGKDDGSISIEKPELIGHTNYGLKTTEYTAFYDGILKGVEDGYEGLINIIPHASLIDEDYEYINKREYQTNFLVTKGNFLRVGTTEYNSINTAYAAIEGTEGTITVIKDAYIDYSQQIPSGKNVTLDLNGHSLIMTQPLNISGNVTIINDSTSGGINNISDIAIINSGNTTLKGGTINSDKKNTINNTGTLTVEGATINSTLGYGIYNTSTLIVNSGTIETSTKEAIYTTNNTTINNGVIISENSNCITVSSSTLTVNNGSIESIAGYGINVTNNSNIYIKGGDVVGSTHGIMDNNTSGKIEISGGHIKGNTATGLYTYKNTTITGGIVEGATYGVYKDNQNTILTIGDNDGTINIDSPVLKGDQYGIYINAGQTNFYDGIIKGITDRYYGLINSIADNAQIYEDTEISDKKNYLTDYLIAETEIAININKNKQYGNLQTAMNEASSGDTIELLTSVPLYYDLTIANDKVVTLDLKGNTISANKTITNNGTLSITNTSDKESSIKTSGAIVLLSNKSNLSLNNIKLTNNNADNYVITNDGKLTATSINIDSINGINSSNDATINNSTLKASKIALNNTGKLVINNGNYIGTNYSIYSNSTKDVNITGATLNGNYYNSGNNEVIFSNGIINNNIQNNISKLTILNSTINNSKITNNGNLILEGTTYRNILGSTNQSSLDTGISNSNKLTIDNSSLIVNDQEEGKHSQLILNTGELNIINNSKVSIGMNASNYEYRAITNQGSGEINIESSEIDAFGGTITYGIYNNSANASVTILSGKIDVERATTGYGIYNNNGTFTMGHYEGTGGSSANVSITDPLIYVQGNTRGIGVKKINGSINFYDGIIKASKYAKPETTTNVEKNYEVTTYVDDETNFEYALLEFMGNDYQGDTVALLNGVYYKTVQDAIDKCEEGYTITLLKSVSEDLVIPTDKYVTLNLNKHSITTNLTNSGTFIVYNGILQNFDRNTIVNHGTLIMGEDDGRVSSTSIRIISETTTIVNDGTFKMYDGYIEGKTTVSGEINEIAEFARLRYEKDDQTEKKYLQSLSEASIRAKETDLIITVNPSGGVYNGSKELFEVFKKFEEDYTLLTPTKKGCNFTGWEASEPETLVGAGTLDNPYKIIVGLSDITVTAKWEVDERAVARIGEDYYFTLREAFDEAQDGDTVELIKNVTESATTRKKITLDLANYKITGQIINLGDLRVINGTIENPNGAAIDNRRNLTLGDNDGEMLENNVKIIGSNIGIDQGGRFDFYDGFIEGDVALLGKVDNVPKGYFLYNDYDINNDCQKVYLIGNPENAVAETRVGGTQYYFRLQDAINTTALTGYEIFIRRNFEATYALEIPSESNIVINTNGNDFQVGNDFDINGNLKIYNPSFTRTKISSARTINNNGTLYIDNVDIDETDTDAYAILNNGTLTVKDSKITSHDNNTVYTNGELITEEGAELVSNTYAVYNNQSTPLVLESGIIGGIDNHKELVLDGTVLIDTSTNSNINGVRTNYSKARVTMNNGEIYSYGTCINAEIPNSNMEGVIVTINDGKLTSKNSYGIYARSYTQRNQNNSNNDKYTTIVTVNGGEIKSVSSSIYMTNYSMLYVNGGKITSTGTTAQTIYCNYTHACDLKNAEINTSYYGLFLQSPYSFDTAVYENLTINSNSNGASVGMYFNYEYRYIHDYTLKNININMSKAPSNRGIYIYNSNSSSYPNTFNMENVNIESPAVGIYVSYYSTINFKSGSIKAEQYAIQADGTYPTVNIGDQSLEYDKQNPYITGGLYAVYAPSSTVNFYNGQLRGSTYGYSNQLAGLRKKMELAEELDPTPNFEKLNTISVGNASVNPVPKYAKQKNGYARITYIGETNGTCENNQQYDFDYTGATEEFSVPCTGRYSLETWGSGGSYVNTSAYGGYGGYSYGEIELTAAEKLYVTVGGYGSSLTTKEGRTTAGFNGGSPACTNSTSIYTIGGGGGATHIATSPGLLSELENNKSSVIMVAGGGAGFSYYYNWQVSRGGNGGGYKGGGSYYLGGTQTEGGFNYSNINDKGSFGQGSTYCSTIGAGGGWYGGASSGGGSGYIGHPRLENGAMYGLSVSEPLSGYVVIYLKPKDNFLRVGNEEFNSLDDAVAAIEEEGTVVVIKDAELTEASEIPLGKKITLDLNNKIFTTSQPITNKGNLTITDNTNDKNGKIVNSVTNVIDNQGSISIKDIDIEATKNVINSTAGEGNILIDNSKITGAYIINLLTSDNVEINNSELTATAYGIYSTTSGNTYEINDSIIKTTSGAAFYLTNSKSIKNDITINSSTLEGSTYSMYLYNYSSGTVSINDYKFKDSTFKSTSNYAIYNQSGNTIISFDNCNVTSIGTYGLYLNGTGPVTIDGGTYTGKNAAIYVVGGSQVVNINSGTVKGEPTGIEVNTGTVNIGNKDEELTRDTPIIIGEEYGVKNNNGYANFYNGILKGRIYGYNNNLSGIRVNTVVREENAFESEDAKVLTYSTTNYSEGVSKDTPKLGNGYARITYIGETNSTCSNEDTYIYDYTNSEQVFTTPCTGKYSLEVWGAGTPKLYTNNYTYPGKGGYSYGEITLTQNEKLYINVGGAGKVENTRDKVIPGGYNGGGDAIVKYNSSIYASSGGGATHIATQSGLLSTLSNNKSAVIIVAGGAGGGTYYSTSYYASGGNAGGYIAGAGSTSRSKKALGGTQTEAGYYLDDPTIGVGSFGQGASSVLDENNNATGGAGGGGFYGGGTTIPDYVSSGSGGSSYIGSSRLTNAYMVGYNVSNNNWITNYLAQSNDFLEVDGVTYNNFADAIEAVNGTGTIKVIENAITNETVTMPLGKDITLDLNNKTLTMSNTITNLTNFVVTDSSIEKNGKLINGKSNAITNNKNLVVEYVDIESKAYGIYINATNATTEVRNNSKIQGSTAIYYNATSSVSIDESDIYSTSSYGIFVKGNNSELTINHSFIKAKSDAIYYYSQMSSEQLLINNSTVLSDSGYGIYDYQGSRTEVNYGDIKILNSSFETLNSSLYTINSNVEIKNTNFESTGVSSEYYTIYLAGTCNTEIGDNTSITNIYGNTLYTNNSINITDTNIKALKMGINIIKGDMTLTNVDIDILNDKSGYGIYAAEYETNLVLNNTNINSKSIGVYLGDTRTNRKTLKLNSGSIVGELYGIYQKHTDTLIEIGNENDPVSVTNPLVEGGLYSINREGGNFYFYSGLLKGYIKANPGNIDIVREGYYVEETNEDMQIYLQKYRNRNTNNSSANAVSTNAKLGNGAAKVTYIDNSVSIEQDDVAYSYLDCESLVGTEYSYATTYGRQVFTATCPGTYKLEVWGGQGEGKNPGSGGKGGYASGYINLDVGTPLNIFVGSSGSNGGYNGGGTGKYTGGGATDIRLGSDSLYSRIIVAGGGGAGTTSTYYPGCVGGAGGGTNGNPSPACAGYSGGGGSSQTSGAAFGSGKNGGGGGWYGGSSNSTGAGGGSGFVFISTSGVPSGYLVDSKYHLFDTELIAGSSNIPSYNGKYTISGNSGDGYAKITYVKSKKVVNDIKVKLVTSVGTLENNEIGYNKGDVLGNIPAPTVEDTNLIFKGWYVDPDYSKKVSANTEVMSSMTLYAKFIYNDSTCASLVNHTYTFDYTNTEQIFNVVCPGKYKLEVWGAQGGNSTYFDTSNEGGYGGYSVGEIDLDKYEKLYINVGGQGQSATIKGTTSCPTCKNITYSDTYGYNGGGYAYAYSSSSTGSYSNGTYAGGGGATHIATSPGLLKTFGPNNTNILLVAGGGGGSYTSEIYPDYSGDGGHAGGIKGTDGVPTSGKCINYGTGATQVAVGTYTACPVGGSTSTQTSEPAAFGQGANRINNNSSYYFGGGGGGFYGGGSGYYGPGGGGSSYIGSTRLYNKYMYAYNSEDDYVSDYSYIAYLVELRETIHNKTQDKSYVNLQTALNEANENDVIELTDDTNITYDVSVFDDMSITLDLNGHKLKSYRPITNDGSLIITNNSQTSSTIVSNSSFPVVINNSNLDINKVSATGNYVIENSTSGILNADNININVNKIGIENNGKMTLTNSSVTGDLYGIYSNASSPEVITNCTLSSQLTAFYKYSTEKTTITNTNINGQLNNAKTNAKLVINGGTITKTISNSGDTTIDGTTITYNSTSTTEETVITNSGLLTLKDSIINHTNTTYVNLYNTNTKVYTIMNIITVDNTGTLTSTNTKYTLVHTNNRNKDLNILRNSGIVNSTSDEYTVSGGTTAYAINNSSSNTTNINNATIKAYNSDKGFGIYSTSGSMRMTGGTVESYQSKDSGGVYVVNGNPILDNVTVTVHDSEENSYGAYLEGGQFTLETGKLKVSGDIAYGSYATRGTLTLGIYDGRGTDAADVSTTNPYVEAIGTTTGIGIRKGNGSIEFFDGYVTGSTSPRAQGDIISATDYNYEIVTYTDEVTGYNYEIPEFIK